MEEKEGIACETYYKVMEKTYHQLTEEQYWILCRDKRMMEGEGFAISVPWQVHWHYDRAKEFGFKEFEFAALNLFGPRPVQYVLLARKEGSGSLPFLIARWGNKPLKRWADFIEQWLMREASIPLSIGLGIMWAFLGALGVWFTLTPWHILWRVAETFLGICSVAVVIYYGRIAYYSGKIPSPFKV